MDPTTVFYLLDLAEVFPEPNTDLLLGCMKLNPAPPLCLLIFVAVVIFLNNYFGYVFSILLNLGC